MASEIVKDFVDSKRSSSPDLFLDSDKSNFEESNSEGISASINSIDLSNGDYNRQISTDEESTHFKNEEDSSQSKSQKRPLTEDEVEEEKIFSMQISIEDQSSNAHRERLTKREKKKQRRIIKDNLKLKSKASIPTVSAAPHSDDSSPRGTPYSTYFSMSADHPGCPPVEASSRHSVLVKLPLLAEGEPPPHPTHVNDVWDAHHVRMPYSASSLYPSTSDGRNELSSRWDVIYNSLSKPIESVDELQAAILEYNARYKTKWIFGGLQKLIHSEFGEEEQTFFFTNTLPKIRDLALRLPELVTTSVPLLQANRNHSVTLSQLQVASLLANAFFCTFPRRNAKGYDTEYGRYPDINFNRLFFHEDQRCLEKMKCILNYFRLVTENEPDGLMTLTRRKIECPSPSEWQGSTEPLPKLYISHTGVIEEFCGFLQMDFANKYMGGGVLGKGCVQEEIRFVLCPELLVSRLLVEELKRDEALLFVGVEQFNEGAGYGDSFRWCGTYVDTTSRDHYRRKLCQIVALDALHFRRNKMSQYQEMNVLREMNKAMAGFLPLEGSRGRPVAVATGNWGCGAFKGDPQLKVLIQAVACGLSRRDMVYLTFSDEGLKTSIADLYEALQSKKVTVGSLSQCLFRYNAFRNDEGTNLYDYLRASLLDRTDHSPNGSERLSSSMDEGASAAATSSQSESLSGDIRPSPVHLKKREGGNQKITQFFTPVGKSSN